MIKNIKKSLNQNQGKYARAQAPQKNITARNREVVNFLSPIVLSTCHLALFFRKWRQGTKIMATLGDSIYKDSIYKSNDTKYS